MLDLCIVNSWLLYRATVADCSKHLSEFKLDVARALIIKREPDDEYVNHNARYDLVDHFPRKLQNSKHLQRCKYQECQRESMFTCRKCEVILCLTNSNDQEDCFYAFHHK